jgi:hypothetical protein
MMLWAGHAKNVWPGVLSNMSLVKVVWCPGTFSSSAMGPVHLSLGRGWEDICVVAAGSPLDAGPGGALKERNSVEHSNF